MAAPATPATPAQVHLATAMDRARPRLVRLCAAVTGDSAAAEDLAQEALLQAWVHADKLREPHDLVGLAHWLDAFARNVCLRWQRAQGRSRQRVVSLDQPSAVSLDGVATAADALATTNELDPADAFERAELERLLERAMASLPALTRDVLIRHYLHETPHATIAAELRLSEAVVAQRLHRGRLAMRQALANDLRHDASAFDLPLPADDAPFQTRIWCPLCGACRLMMYRAPASACYGFRCPGCSGGTLLGLTGPCVGRPDPVTELTSPKAIVARQFLWLSNYYYGGLARHEVPCERCGRLADVLPHLPLDLPQEVRAALPSQHGVTIVCPVCGVMDTTPLSHLTLDLPETVRFWRKHPRIHRLPEREVEAEGQPAILTTYASLGEHARLVVLTARDSLQVLAVHGAPAS